MMSKRNKRLPTIRRKTETLFQKKTKKSENFAFGLVHSFNPHLSVVKKVVLAIV